MTCHWPNAWAPFEAVHYGDYGGTNQPSETHLPAGKLKTGTGTSPGRTRDPLKKEPWQLAGERAPSAGLPLPWTDSPCPGISQRDRRSASTLTILPAPSRPWASQISGPAECRYVSGSLTFHGWLALNINMQTRTWPVLSPQRLLTCIR